MLDGEWRYCHQAIQHTSHITTMKEQIDVLTPLSSYNPYILSETVNALLQQGITFTWHFDVTPDPQRYSVKSICAKRNRLRERAKTEYTFWVDSDNVPPPYIIPKFIRLIEKHPRIAGAGLDYVGKHWSKLHIGMASMLVKTRIMQALPPFRYIGDVLNPRAYCECTVFHADLKVRGYVLIKSSTSQGRHINIKHDKQSIFKDRKIIRLHISSFFKITDEYLKELCGLEPYVLVFKTK